MNSAAPAFVEQIAAYLAHWRALGRQYTQAQWLLEKLLRDLPAIGYDDLTADSFQPWLDSCKHLHPNTRRERVRILRHFCVFRRRSDPGSFVPGPEMICRARPPVTPVILGERQIARMLIAADALKPSRNSPLRPATMRMAVVLLYTTGLRLGELQRLVLGDVEDDGALLRVRESKFHKTRLLPLSSSTRAELLAYLVRRAGVGFDTRPTAPLLCTRARGRMKAYSTSGLQCGVNPLLRDAAASTGQARRPRLHDLRHSFGIQALIRWYRQGADVQAQLPKLAMYMGHASIESTAYYLRWTDEIAALASDRFAQHFAATIGGRS
jgi:integrase/recombinase XerD